MNDYNKKKEEIEKSDISVEEKKKEIKKVERETAKEVDKSIKGSIGVSVPGIPVELKAAMEYNTHKKY